jgi:non-heme chloroperoxidase
MIEAASAFCLSATRRDLLLAGGAALVATALPGLAFAANEPNQIETETNDMSFIKTKDGTEIYYKDWGPCDGQAVVFHHGWPLSSDDWDSQMLFFLGKGFRVIAYDRRGHGRSTQTNSGNDMDTYASDAVDLAKALDLRGAIHVGHSTGGGEVAHYVARAEPGRVSKAALVGAITPVILKSDSNLEGAPMEVFDGFRAAIMASRTRFFLDIPSGPFYGYNRPDAQPSQAVIQNWWRQAMMGGAKAQYDCVKALSETDFTQDLKTIDVAVLVMHGEDDQIVPYANTAPAAVKFLKNGTLKTYKGLSHGMCTTHPELINADLLAFFQS